MKRQIKDREEVFAKCISDKGITSRIYKELLLHDKKNKQPNEIFKWIF